MSNILDKTQASFKQVVSKGAVQGDPLFLLRKSRTDEDSNITDIEIFENILNSNKHLNDIEIRRCYSLYVGKCLEAGVQVSMDATEAYEYIKRKENN